MWHVCLTKSDKVEVVLGENGGSKVKDAQKYSIPTISEEELLIKAKD